MGGRGLAELVGGASKQSGALEDVAGPRRDGYTMGRREESKRRQRM